MQIGGKTQQEALESLRDMTTDMSPILISEYTARIEKSTAVHADKRY